MFRSLLIANRGEIACRIIRTARRLGLRTIAVYSDADADALHVREADIAFPLGPAPAEESYLNIERILSAAKRSGAEAIHPGYGFLSENAAFADACAQAGLNFVGPPAEAIRAMGLKDEAKRRMEAAGVPVVPGYHAADFDPETLRQTAEEIGYPIVVKAVAGGGGKGMRRVDHARELDTALAAAAREAESSFGNSGVMIEKWITRPRHIEVQVFADSAGDVIHLFERDCSIQRRHQKVLEEAPAPGISEALRNRLGETAVRAVRAIDYRGAGTIEFILDASVSIDEAKFYFMEMNTRLQVEHPVTEAITGTDLVEWQLRVAAGEPLPSQQSDLTIKGHSIEVRLYAEDPSRDYLPQTGQLIRFSPPDENAMVRVETGVTEGDVVTPFYDPMMAKLIVHETDRPRAIERLQEALSSFEVAGVTSNLALLHAISETPAFAAGDVQTAFLEEHLAEGAVALSSPPLQAIALLVAATLTDRSAQALCGSGEDPWSPWNATDSFRLNEDGVDRFHWRFGEEKIEVTVHSNRSATTLEWDERASVLHRIQRQGDTVSAVIDGVMLKAKVIFHAEHAYLIRGPSTLCFTALDDPTVGDDAGATAGAIRAPLPGLVTAVLVSDGDRVKAGQTLLRMEAMKMEHTLKAQVDGQIGELNTEVGAQVDEGSILLVVQ